MQTPLTRCIPAPHGVEGPCWGDHLRRRANRMGRVIEAFLQERSPATAAFVAEWENPTKWPKELKSFGYRFEKHNEDHDPLCIDAEASIRSPTYVTTVNVTLAIRKALRRYLCIEPAESL